MIQISIYLSNPEEQIHPKKKNFAKTKGSFPSSTSQRSYFGQDLNIPRLNKKKIMGINSKEKRRSKYHKQTTKKRTNRTGKKRRRRVSIGSELKKSNFARIYSLSTKLHSENKTNEKRLSRHDNQVKASTSYLILHSAESRSSRGRAPTEVEKPAADRKEEQ